MQVHKIVRVQFEVAEDREVVKLKLKVKLLKRKMKE